MNVLTTVCDVLRGVIAFWLRVFLEIIEPKKPRPRPRYDIDEKKFEEEMRKIISTLDEPIYRLPGPPTINGRRMWN